MSYKQLGWHGEKGNVQKSRGKRKGVGLKKESKRWKYTWNAFSIASWVVATGNWLFYTLPMFRSVTRVLTISGLPITFSPSAFKRPGRKPVALLCIQCSLVKGKVCFVIVCERTWTWYIFLNVHCNGVGLIWQACLLTFGFIFQTQAHSW